MIENHIVYETEANMEMKEFLILIIYGELNNFASLQLLLSYHLDITPLNKAVFCP